MTFPELTSDSEFPEFDLSFEFETSELKAAGLSSKKTVSTVLTPNRKWVFSEFDNYSYLRKSRSDLTDLIQKYIPQDNGLLSFILLKATSDASEEGGTSDNLSRDFNFTAEDFDEVLSVKFPKHILRLNPTTAEIKEAVRIHLEWIFGGNWSEITKHEKEFTDLAEIYVKAYQERDIPWYEELAQALSELFELMAEILSKVLSDLLTFIAEQVRKLKIEDPNLWRPFNLDGRKNDTYTGFFFPDLSDLINFDFVTEKFNSIDNVISSTISVQAFSDSRIAKNNAKYSYEYGIQSLYVTIRDYLAEIWSMVQSLWTAFSQFIAYANAFLVGLYNGLIEIVAGTIELAAMISKLIDPKELQKAIDGVKAFIQQIQEEGLFAILKQILEGFIQKYRDASSSYDIIKFIGEDIAEIIVEIVLLIFSGGGSAIKRLSQVLDELLELVSKKADDVADSARKYNKIKDYVYNRRKNKADHLNDPDKRGKLDAERKQLDDADGLQDPKSLDQLRKYPDRTVRGDLAFRKEFKTELEKIAREIDADAAFRSRLNQRTAQKSRKKNFDIKQYVKKVRQLAINRKKGQLAEELFQKKFGGLKPGGIDTNDGFRFIDNIKDNVANEIKSGPIRFTNGFKRQFMKDIEIVLNQRKGVKSYLWHCIEGIDEPALDWAQKLIETSGLSGKVKFVIY